MDMNIIIMGNFLYPEGMACTKRIQHYIDYLNCKKVPVRLLILRQAETTLKDENLEGYHNGIFYKTIGNDIALNINAIPTICSYFWMGSKCLIKWKLKSKKNIIVNYGDLGIENFLFICLGKIIGYKIIFDIVEDFESFDGHIHFFRKIKFFLAKFTRKMLPVLADGIIVISATLFKKYRAKIKNYKPLKIIPVSAKIKKKVDKKEFNNPIKVVYSGTFGAKDDLNSLLLAFENIHDKSKRIQLLLTGKGEQKNIEKITAAIKGKNGIKYLGYLPDKKFYDFIQDADILCMVRTRSEFANAGFPFKLGEYLATGNPVIASNVGDVEYYLQNMKDALLVAPENSKEIEIALEYLIENPARALKIGNAGQNVCNIFFNPEKNSKILFDLLNDL